MSEKGTVIRVDDLAKRLPIIVYSKLCNLHEDGEVPTLVIDSPFDPGDEWLDESVGRYAYKYAGAGKLVVKASEYVTLRINNAMAACVNATREEMLEKLR